jgi:calcineurin-like phosphoesterase family protein
MAQTVVGCYGEPEAGIVCPLRRFADFSALATLASSEGHHHPESHQATGRERLELKLNRNRVAATYRDSIGLPGHLHRRTLGVVTSALLALAIIWSATQVGSGPTYAQGINGVSRAISGDPVIMAAGDIACDPIDSGFNGGNGTTRRCHEKWTAAQLSGATAVLPLGDEQYQCGALNTFQQSYDPSWGQQKSIEHPVVGNHEYYHGCPDTTAGATGYFTYFGAAATPLQPDCTSKCKGYYSYSIGSWHFIALNSECGNVGGCAAGSAQENWLQADLAASPAACTIAYWHRPLFTSGGSLGDSQMHDIWVDLYNAHVDIVLNGHDHIYERFAAQDPNANPTPNGIMEFIVGTGGQTHGSITSVAANSQVRNNTTFGVLQITLHADSYDWRFVPDGKSGTFIDSGSASCV